jgi:hypothetical protein
VQRTFNYTERSKIEKSHVTFSIADGGDETPEFNVVFNFDPSKISAPERARVFVEAHYKETRQRFDFGTVAAITPPKNRRLDRIDLSGPTLFDVLIVDESGKNGRLIARGDAFHVAAEDDESAKNSLLSIRRFQLGQVPWKVEFTPGNPPELLVNRAIPGIVERAKTDRLFQALVFPAALREILIHYLWNDEDEEDEHFGRWIRFAEMMTEDQKPDSLDPSEIIAWVDRVVAGFAERFHLVDLMVDKGAEEE